MQDISEDASAGARLLNNPELSWTPMTKNFEKKNASDFFSAVVHPLRTGCVLIDRIGPPRLVLDGTFWPDF